MSNKKQRDKNRVTSEKLHSYVANGSACANCGRLTLNGHFVSPSFQESGYFICNKNKEVTQ